MEIISQADAGRLVKLSRARIGQLVGTKIRQALDEDGNPIRGKVILQDVLNLTKGKGGRPKKNNTPPLATVTFDRGYAD